MIRLDRCCFFVITALLFLHRRLDTVPVPRLLLDQQPVLVQPAARRWAQLVLALVHLLQLVHRLPLESLALLVLQQQQAHQRLEDLELAYRRRLASEKVERLSQGKDNNWHHFQVVHGFQRGLDRLAFRRFL